MPPLKHLGLPFALLLLLLAAAAATAATMARLLLPCHTRAPRTAWQQQHRAALHRPPTIPRPRQQRGTAQLAASQPPPSKTPAPPPAHVTILGGGLAGLSTAWHLTASSNGPASITIVDPRPPGQAEASSVAGGLLHPLTPKNKLIWAGLEGFEATGALLAASKAALERAGDQAGVERLHSPPGAILRPALTPHHQKDYPVAAEKLPEWLEWLDGAAWRARAYGGSGDDQQQQRPPQSGLLLKRSVIISMPDYLRGLWLALEHHTGVSVRWERAVAPSLEALLGRDGGCDALVVASGAGIRAFPELRALPMELVRGRTLLVEDEPAAPLPSALLCGEYVVPGVDPTTTSSSTTTPQRRVLRCGATREYIRDPWARPPPEGDDDDEAAGGPELLEALKRKAEALHPGLFAAGREAYGVTAGTRVAAKRSNLGKLPIVGRVPLPGGERRVWLYTGLGGRGLIHHAYLGGLLARAIVRDDEEGLPKELRATLGALGE